MANKSHQIAKIICVYVRVRACVCGCVCVCVWVCVGVYVNCVSKSKNPTCHECNSDLMFHLVYSSIPVSFPRAHRFQLPVFLDQWKDVARRWPI